MNKKLLSSVSTLFLSGVFLAACGNQVADAPVETEEETESVEEVVEEKEITIDILLEDESVDDLTKELEVEEDLDLMSIMEMNYDISATEEGFMTAIEGYEQDEAEGLYWLYYINDEMAEVGAADYIPEESDLIEWNLEAID